MEPKMPDYAGLHSRFLTEVRKGIDPKNVESSKAFYLERIAEIRQRMSTSASLEAQSSNTHILLDEFEGKVKEFFIQPLSSKVLRDSLVETMAEELNRSSDRQNIPANDSLFKSALCGLVLNDLENRNLVLQGGHQFNGTNCSREVFELLKSLRSIKNFIIDSRLSPEEVEQLRAALQMSKEEQAKLPGTPMGKKIEKICNLMQTVTEEAAALELFEPIATMPSAAYSAESDPRARTIESAHGIGITALMPADAAAPPPSAAAAPAAAPSRFGFIKKFAKTVGITGVNNIVATASANCEKSTTYFPAGVSTASAHEGILDFTHVFPQYGVAYVADGTGHGEREKVLKLQNRWNDFNVDFIKTFRSTVKGFTSEEQAKAQLEAFMNETVRNLSGDFLQRAGKNSTFSLSAIIEVEGRKYLASINLGDSFLIHVSDNEVHLIDPSHKSQHVELGGDLTSFGSPYFDWREVKAGDRIYGFTDGVTDFLPMDILQSILNRKNNLNSANWGATFRQIERAIKEVEVTDPDPKSVRLSDDVRSPYHEQGCKPYVSARASHSDDISGFYMEVP